jgi:hypothetical protein
MSTVNIRRLDAIYRLPAWRPEKERLDSVLRKVLESGLETALERAGVQPWEQICIRRVHVAVRLNLGLPDGVLLDTWV